MFSVGTFFRRQPLSPSSPFRPSSYQKTGRKAAIRNNAATERVRSRAWLVGISPGVHKTASRFEKTLEETAENLHFRPELVQQPRQLVPQAERRQRLFRGRASPGIRGGEAVAQGVHASPGDVQDQA